MDCFSCGVTGSIESQPVRERIWWDGRWRVAHAIRCALPGWLVVVPARHVLSLADLTPDEAVALGPLLAAASRAVVEVTGCAKVYLALFAELEEFRHLHIHLVPRHADLADDLRGTRIFDYQKRPESEWVTTAEMDRIGGLLAGSLAGRGRGPTYTNELPSRSASPSRKRTVTAPARVQPLRS
ncbi:MAG TPA: HIT family protein [Terriglobales bacterium]|nr:HIT family protein [Terriglobales bacterium]